tara:strand:+ start:135 stop:284 length:150 start_codon:yes stop_codon:yes gene_type:complete
MNSTQRLKIETPIGSIESDSGNHFVDVVTVVGVIVFLMVLRKFFSKYIH